MPPEALAGLWPDGLALARPWALLLAPLPYLAFRLARPAPPGGALRPSPGLARWLAALGGGPGRGGGAPGLALALAGWAALLAALAGPELRGPELTRESGREALIALDISASMSERDMTGPEGPVERIAASRAAARRLLEGREGDRVGLIGFGTEAYLIAPPTHDLRAVSALLDEMTVGMPGLRTDLGQAIGLAARALGDRPAGERLLVVLTDGAANAGDLAALDAAALAAEAGIRLHLVAIAAGIDEERRNFLVGIADRAGGQAHFAEDPAALDRVAAEIAALRPVASTEPVRLSDDLSPFFASAALAIAALVIARERTGA